MVLRGSCALRTVLECVWNGASRASRPLGGASGPLDPQARYTFQKLKTPQAIASPSGIQSGMPTSPSQARKM